MAEQQIVMKVPEEIIKAQVQAAVAQALGDPQRLVEAFVKEAMNAKTNSYDRETIFDRMMGQMIRETAVEVFKVWLAEQRPAIRKQIVATLDARSKEQVKKMADRLLGALEKAEFNVYIKEDR